MQKKVADAKEILTPLVMTEDSNPTLQMLLDWSMALSGWLETNPADGRLVVVPGATGTAPAARWGRSSGATGEGGWEGCI